MPEPTPTNPDVRYCVTAAIDLVGFSAHLETGSYDVRTTIGQEAIKRLNTLEEALQYMCRERDAMPTVYPSELYYQRINDSVILTIDLPDILTPSIGETAKVGFSPDDISRHFDFSLYDGDQGEEHLMTDFRSRVQESIGDLIKFVGVVSRIHLFINSQEHNRAFPGAKTICATGFRRRFMTADGHEDRLAANFSYSNAFLAEKSLHGARFFVDDGVTRLLCLNVFALNLVRFGCFISKAKEFDPLDEHRDEPYLEMKSVLSTPQEVEIFRKEFAFREMSPVPLSYLQTLERLSEYLQGVKNPALTRLSVLPRLLASIRTGPDIDASRSGIAPKGNFFWNAISQDIRILFELIESGSSPTGERQRLERVASVPSIADRHIT